MLLKVPENEMTPSPFGKLPGGTAELTVMSGPAGVEPSNAVKVKGAEGRPAVAKSREILDRFDEKFIVTAPSWPGVQKPCTAAFPDRVAKFKLVTLHTDIGPETDAVSPFTVSVKGATVPAAMFSKLKIASAFAGVVAVINNASGTIERRKGRTELITFD
ncbi:MAG: hypothetical protein JO185_02350 [Acidobacteriaceae bacterium]|nr:hypothetical protein [Acidobacteriaceae bacterium]